jgi:hypothetical protein
LKITLDSSFQKIHLFELYMRNVRQSTGSTNHSPSPDATAREILTASFNTFNVFLGDRAPEDDVTLVVIRIIKE